MKNQDSSTKLRIIHAAKKLLAKNSYDYVSTRMIAAEAGVGQSVIFFHFGSKENLASAVINDILEYHRLYYSPINEKIHMAYCSNQMTTNLALDLLKEFIQIQINVAFDPHDRYALYYSVNGYTLPHETIKPLFDDIKKSIELPMAKLLCTYKSSSDIAKAYTICHAVNASLVAFNFTSSFDVIKDIQELQNDLDVSVIKKTLYMQAVSSIMIASL